ncbi:MAG: PLDc N-terminal domain-containing protein [Psychrobacillus sp.]
MIVAFVDLIKVYDTNGPKWLWVIIIFISGIIGSIIYFIVGRRNE